MTALAMTQEQVAAHYKRIGKPIPQDAHRGRGAAQQGVPAPVGSAVPQGAEIRVVRRMNKTEERYAAKLTAEGRPWLYESVKLRLADRTWYTPDFFLPDEFAFHEVKGGFVREDGWMKFKIAKELHAAFGFQAWQWANNSWTRIA